MFHDTAWTNHRLVRVSLRLVNRPSLASYWKFNTSLLEIWDFRDQLESLVQPAFVGTVTGNKWWGFLKRRIRDFTTKYSRKLNFDWTKVAKSLKDKLSQAMEVEDSLGINLARQDLECEAFGLTSMITWLAVLTFQFKSFVAILTT